MRSCPPGPGLAKAWSDSFPVPILMMDIPTHFRGRSHARKQNELPENPHVRNIMDAPKRTGVNWMRGIRKDVDELVRRHVPRDKN
eukprot:14052004-Heterocapsa_arctica.AAC.1